MNQEDNKPLVSIILRSYNEEKWITACLESIFSQSYKNFEVILVDNRSTDRTVEKATKYGIKLLDIEKFLPGRALNIGVEASKGKYFVCISGHCIPTNSDWLKNLVEEIESDTTGKLAGVYGRQEPMSFTPATDKRDLLTVFGLDKKIQIKDSFFHNANSIIRKDLWDIVPFDDKATNIEDRIWAREMIRRGYFIIYTPEASVYHYHGIHQNQNMERCANVVRIIENLNKEDGKDFKNNLGIERYCVAFIPVKGEILQLGEHSLLEYTIKNAKNSKFIKDVFVLTDSEKNKEIAESLGAKVPFLRDISLSHDYIDLEQVYSHSLNKLEEMGIYPDVVVPLEITFPFRPANIIDEMITLLFEEGVDSVMPVRAEFSPAWVKKENNYKPLDPGFAPRKFKEPIYISVKGVGCACYASVLRDGQLLGDKIEMLELNDPKSFIEVRDQLGLALAESLIKS